MADNKKIYEVVINGLKQCFDDTVKLTDALKAMDSAINTQRSVMSAFDDVMKTRISTSDELAKTEERLLNYDREYQKQLEENKATLSDYQKAVKQQVKDENAWATIEANVTDTYRDKQKLLSALGTVIRSYNAQTEEEKAELQSLKEQYAMLNSELKAFDKEMGNAYRNVGNYAEGVKEGIDASASLKSQLKEMTAELARMGANGEKGTDAYNALAEKAGKLKDAMNDASTAIGKYASDSKALDDVISVAQTATGAFGLYTSTMKLFGEENEEVAKSIEKLQAIQTALQSLQALSNQLTTDGTLVNKAYLMVLQMLNGAKEQEVATTEAETVAEVTNTTAVNANSSAKLKDKVATVASTVATKAYTAVQSVATTATKLFSMALNSIPLMFIAGLILTLITHFGNLTEWLGFSSDASKGLGEMFERLGSIAKGVGNVIVKWLTNPIITFAKTIKKVLSGDFDGALKEVTNGLKNQFKVAENFSSAYTKSEAKNAEKRTKKQAEEQAKQTKNQLEELKARKGNDAKYSKEGIALQKKEFEERKKAAKGNAEELRKIKLEELTFNRECEEKKTADAKKSAKQRTADANDEAKKREERAKAEVKLTEDLIKSTFSEQKESISNDLETWQILGESARRDLSKIKPPITDEEKANLEEALTILKSFEGELLKIASEEGDIDVIFGKIKDVFNKGIFDAVNDDNLRMLFTTLSEELVNSLGIGFNKITTEYQEKASEIKSNAEKLNEDLKKIYGDIGSLEDLRKGFTQGGTVEEFAQHVRKEISNGNEKMYEAYTLIQNERDLLTSKIEEGLSSKEQQTLIWDNYFLDYINALQKFNNDFNKELDKTTSKANESIGTVTKILASDTQTTKNDLKKTLDSFTSFIDNYTLAKSKLSKDGILSKGLKEDRKDMNEWSATMRDVFVDNAPTLISDYSKLWDDYLDDVKKIYGEDSKEYEKALDDKKDAMKSYRKAVAEGNKQIAEDASKAWTAVMKNTNSDVRAIAEDLVSSMESIFGSDFWTDLFGKAGEDISKGFGYAMQSISSVVDTVGKVMDFAIEEAKDKVDVISDLYDDAVDKVEKTTDRINDINDAILNAEGSRKEELKDQLADEQLLLLQQQAEEARIREEKEKAERELEQKERNQKKMQLGQDMAVGLANTASAVLKAYKDWGWPLGAVFGGIIGAMGAVQTSLIARQMSKLRDGGLIGTEGISRSHEQGGHRIQGTSIEVEGGEYVINKRSTAKYYDLIEAINKDNPNKVLGISGLKYANGGELDIESVDANLRTISMEAQMLRAIESIDMHPVVSVTDINRVQKNLTRVQQYSGKR